MPTGHPFNKYQKDILQDVQMLHNDTMFPFPLCYHNNQYLYSNQQIKVICRLTIANAVCLSQDDMFQTIYIFGSTDSLFQN